MRTNTIRNQVISTKIVNLLRYFYFQINGKKSSKNPLLEVVSDFQSQISYITVIIEGLLKL
jgi:hypothetical protein